jgi:hypothetical protein
MKGKLLPLRKRNFINCFCISTAFRLTRPTTGFIRPDGEIDERIIDWGQDLWKRKELQFMRLSWLRNFVLRGRRRMRSH